MLLVVDVGNTNTVLGAFQGDALKASWRVETNKGRTADEYAVLLRQLMERQALRRVNAGSLSDDEVERMGETFLKLDRRMKELKVAFGLEGEELGLHLGPIGDLE
jgi:pantothenate kinase type III